METMLDLAPYHPGATPIETATGGWSVIHRATMRWKGSLGLGPYEEEEDAIAVEAMLSELSFGDRWCMFPLHRPAWTGDPLYCTAVRDDPNGGTILGVTGQRDDMAAGQMFTVGDPDDANTQHPRRVRKIVSLDLEPGVSYLRQAPPLPQAADARGAGNDAALVEPATHIPVRLTRPAGVDLPLSAAAPGRYGPWVVEWTEYIFTGGGG